MKPEGESVFDEPWMKPPPLPSASSESPSAPDPHAQPDNYNPETFPATGTRLEGILHSVYTEPHLVVDGAPTQLDQLLAEKRKGHSTLALFAVVFLTAIAAGPLSILGTIFSGQQGIFAGLYVIAIGPVVEETMKLIGLFYLLEKKPWYIVKGWHILCAALISAMLFGIIENLIYSHVYLRKMDPLKHEEIMTFRWSVTVLLHTLTTLVGAIGLRRAWRATVAKGRLFDSDVAEPYIAAAIIIHGGYNTLALILGNWLTDWN